MIKKILLLLLVIVVFNGCSSESYIKERIEKANYCEEDSDCTVASFGCPFGCWNHINKAEVKELQKLVNAYNKEASPCKYKCSVSPRDSDLECANNKCQLRQAECSSDSECSTAGCSGQICTTKEKANDIITTCEYKAEYDCYKLTSCGCANGKCNWVVTQDFSKCLEEKGG